MREAEDEYEYARLLSTTGYAASMWLQGRLTDRTLKMEGEVFRVAVKLRLGMACGSSSATYPVMCMLWCEGGPQGVAPLILQGLSSHC